MAMQHAVTKYGAVEGVVQKGYTVFKGIPYAAAPVGELRWKRPAPPAAWEGVRKADSFSRVCPQIRMPAGSFYHKEFYSEDDQLEQSEDCLYLNIWTPAEDGSEKLPVLFWIHGGGFDHGWGFEKEFDGEAICKNGAILVSINYRCGVFGFFSHPWLDEESNEKISGNYGLFDQLFALRWVRENIAAFGGDPENITIFGQSAGAMSVQSLISSPLTKGLVSKAIMQSGGGIGGLRLTDSKQDALEKGKAFAEKLGARSIGELRALSADTLLAAFQKEGIRFSPHIDGVFLTDSFDNLAQSGQVLDIPYLIGACRVESGLGGAGERMNLGSVNWCKNQLALNRRPAFLYCFDRDMPGDDARSFHSSDLWYVFGTLRRCWRPLAERDQELSRIMTAFWVNFAKTGDPNGEGLPQWDAYTEKSPNRLVFDLEISAEKAELF